MSNQTKSRALTVDRIQSITETIGRANSGDENALADVRNILDEFPELIGDLGGDLAATAESALIAAAAGERRAMAEALRCAMRRLENDLAGPKPTAVEKLLVRRIVMCWLQVTHADCLFAQAEDAPANHLEFLQKTQDRAHRRLLSAVKTLATVRRMALPVRVDVNVDVSVEEEPPMNLGNGSWPFDASDIGGNRLRSLGLASDS